MAKDLFLFILIFIAPIAIWCIDFMLSHGKGYALKKDSLGAISIQFFLWAEISTYPLGLLFSLLMPRTGDFKTSFISFLYRFCIFQIGLLDMWLLIFIVPILWFKIVDKVIPKRQKSSPLWMDLLVMASFLAFMAIIPGTAIIHVRSVQNIFISQQVPFLFIIFILLFNPIFMYFQLRHRLYAEQQNEEK